MRQYSTDAMHPLEGHERSTIVPVRPGAFAAFVESDNYFALRSARQESAAIVGRDCLRGSRICAIKRCGKGVKRS
jgi:hypothetical protein